MLTMFTYGTLKDPLRLQRDGAGITIEQAYVKGFKMYSNNGFFPITEKTGKDSDVIYGTLFTMPKNVIEGYYDRIESYVPGRDPKHNMYNREKVTVYVKGEKHMFAEMYVANEEMFSDAYTDINLIKSGNWDDAERRTAYTWNWGK